MTMLEAYARGIAATDRRTLTTHISDKIVCCSSWTSRQHMITEWPFSIWPVIACKQLSFEPKVVVGIKIQFFGGNCDDVICKKGLLNRFKNFGEIKWNFII